MKTELCELAYKYGCDKCPEIGHSYTPIYYNLFKDKKESFKKILEIGIGSAVSMDWTPGHYCTGASLRMWRDFFSNAWIYGVDTNVSTIFQDDRITTFLYNSTKGTHMKKLLKIIGKDFDLVIDDGNHRTIAQLRTFGILMPMLKKDVVYIIEDSKNPEIIKEKLSDYNCEVFKNDNHKQDTLVIITNK